MKKFIKETAAAAYIIAIHVDVRTKIPPSVVNIIFRADFFVYLGRAA